jgi:hypothetical protein
MVELEHVLLLASAAIVLLCTFGDTLSPVPLVSAAAGGQKCTMTLDLSDATVLPIPGEEEHTLAS